MTSSLARQRVGKSKEPALSGGLKYEGLYFWSGRRDSNPRQPAWKAGTLPTELLPQFHSYFSPKIRLCQRGVLVHPIGDIKHLSYLWVGVIMTPPLCESPTYRTTCRGTWQYQWFSVMIRGDRRAALAMTVWLFPDARLRMYLTLGSLEHRL